MAERKAFTLVELLVVIAVIALLIAILAPTLMGAKGLARAAFCLTNLNALNKSVFLYAERNRGYLMVYSHSALTGKEGTVPQAPANTYKSYICFSDGTRDPSTGLLPPRGLGLVYAAGLLGPAELFYCPDQRDVRSTIANYERPWGSKISAGSGFIRMGYMWNPWVRPVDGTWDAGPWLGNWTYEDGLRIERHPNEWFLTSDLLDRGKTMSHVLTNSATWNMGFVDGHTESWESKWLYQAFTSGVDTSGDWLQYNKAIRGMAHVPGWDVKIIK